MGAMPYAPANNKKSNNADTVKAVPAEQAVPRVTRRSSKKNGKKAETRKAKPPTNDDDDSDFE